MKFSYRRCSPKGLWDMFCTSEWYLQQMLTRILQKLMLLTSYSSTQKFSKNQLNFPQKELVIIRFH
uniref:Uncharacterized protein n=1 Tax=Arundo donax TaxID=35708 RepID=A0A0A8YP28_ARUDO